MELGTMFQKVAAGHWHVRECELGEIGSFSVLLVWDIMGPCLGLPVRQPDYHINFEQLSHPFLADSHGKARRDLDWHEVPL
jgi:hypothetical protein